jgi:hypothetical protein
VRGLPVAACGADFDKTLDSRLGFNNLRNEDSFAEYASELAPGLGSLSPDDYDEADDDFKDDTTYTNSKRQQLRRAQLMSARGELMMYDKRFISMGKGKWTTARGCSSRCSPPLLNSLQKARICHCHRRHGSGTGVRPGRRHRHRRDSGM